MLLNQNIARNDHYQQLDVQLSHLDVQLSNYDSNGKIIKALIINYLLTNDWKTVRAVFILHSDPGGARSVKEQRAARLSVGRGFLRRGPSADQGHWRREKLRIISTDSLRIVARIDGWMHGWMDE